MRLKIALTHAATAAALVLAAGLGQIATTNADDAPIKRRDGGSVPEISHMYVDVDEREVRVAGIDCPQEDSCTVDYRDGSWYVRQVTP